MTEGKAGLDIVFQNLTAALDSSGACLFSTFGVGADDLAEMLSALTGITYTVEEFMKAGERIWNLERLWNLKAGFTADGRYPAGTAAERSDHHGTFQRRCEQTGRDAARILQTARMG